MPYITNEEVAAIRKAVKDNFKGSKFSIVKENNSAVRVSILQSSIDFLAIEPNCGYSMTEYLANKVFGADSEAANYIKRLFAVIDEAHPEKEITYDYDYGSVPNYYLDVQIGKWDRSYTVK